MRSGRGMVDDQWQEARCADHLHRPAIRSVAAGTGPKPTEKDAVSVHYSGSLINRLSRSTAAMGAVNPPCSRSVRKPPRMALSP